MERNKTIIVVENAKQTCPKIPTPSLREFFKDPFGWALAGAVLGINMLATWVNQEPSSPKT